LSDETKGVNGLALLLWYSFAHLVTYSALVINWSLSPN